MTDTLATLWDAVDDESCDTLAVAALADRLEELGRTAEAELVRNCPEPERLQWAGGRFSIRPWSARELRNEGIDGDRFPSLTSYAVNLRDSNPTFGWCRPDDLRMVRYALGLDCEQWSVWYVTEFGQPENTVAMVCWMRSE